MVAVRVAALAEVIRAGAAEHRKDPAGAAKSSAHLHVTNNHCAAPRKGVHRQPP